MGIISDRLKGIVRVEIEGMFPESLLNACALEGLSLWNIEQCGQYKFIASVYEAQLGQLGKLCSGKSCELKTVKLSGGSRNRKLLGRRKWLVICLGAIILLLLLSSLFIWRIDIYGNNYLSKGEILRALAECGVSSGTFRFKLIPDLVRSKMICLIPEIGWMTVNVSGSRAVVLISERQEKPEIYNESECCGIEAGKDGIIKEMFVMNGKPLVCEGQSVLRGETLVSGYMESLSNEPRMVRSRARVMADTWYEITAISPAEGQIKNENKFSYSRFSVKIGKKRINFYPSSRKDIDGCVKIIHEYNLGAKGLFALPITIIREEIVYSQIDVGQWTQSDETGRRMLKELSEAIDGEILSSSVLLSESNGLYYVTLCASCRENIAVNQDVYPGENP